MSEPLSSCVALRAATPEDCRRLWKWRNEQATRDASFNTEYIPYDEHERWFTCMLATSNTRVLIATDTGGQGIGYARFDIRYQEAEVSISIDRAKRGKGYGIAVIKCGSDYLLRSEPVQRVVATIRCDNPASRAAFERAGFIVRGNKKVGDVEACEMVYEGNADVGARE